MGKLPGSVLTAPLEVRVHRGYDSYSAMTLMTGMSTSNGVRADDESVVAHRHRDPVCGALEDDLVDRAGPLSADDLSFGHRCEHQASDLVFGDSYVGEVRCVTLPDVLQAGSTVASFQ